MTTATLPLDRMASHVDVAPGGEVVLRGVLASTHDGSLVDAALTTFPDGAPGGGGVDAGGLVDFEAGGFHLISRDPVRHEVHAVATGTDAAACARLGVVAPCLLLRYGEQAHSRLLTVDDWASSLKGGLTVEVIAPPVYAPVVDEAWLHATDVAAGTAFALLVFVALAIVRRRRRFALSPAGQLRAIADRVREKLERADPVLAAPLRPAMATAARAIARRRLDPTTPEGQRVRAAIARVEQRLDAARAEATADEERHVADTLVREMEAALEASDEMHAPAKETAAI
jgi:hypothetical protein